VAREGTRRATRVVKGSSESTRCDHRECPVGPGRHRMSDSGRPGKQLGHPADRGRGQVGNFGAARGGHGSPKRRNVRIHCACAQQKRAFGWRRDHAFSQKLRMNRACAQKRATGGRAKRRNMRICRACAQKKRAARPARADAF